MTQLFEKVSAGFLQGKGLVKQKSIISEKSIGSRRPSESIAASSRTTKHTAGNSQAHSRRTSVIF